MSQDDFDTNQVALLKWVCVHIKCNTGLFSGQNRSTTTSSSNKIFPGGKEALKHYEHTPNSLHLTHAAVLSSSNFFISGVEMEGSDMHTSWSSFCEDGWEKCRRKRVSSDRIKIVRTLLYFLNTCLSK